MDDKVKCKDCLFLRAGNICMHAWHQGNVCTPEIMHECAEFQLEQTDSVNHPNHYTQGGIECVDAMKACVSGLNEMEAVCTSHALKYLWRWKHKNGAEDIRKCIWWLERLLKEIDNE